MKSQLVQSGPMGAKRAPGNAREISSDLQEMIRRRFHTGAAISALAAVYFCAGVFGLSLAFVNASVSAVWPPTGLALAALLLWGLRLWPGVFIGAFLVNLLTQGSVATAFGIAAGNTLEAVVAAVLVQRFADGIKVFERGRTIFKFVALTAILSTTISATFGVTSLCLGEFARWEHYGSVWLTWWLGDTISDVTVAPLLVIWISQGLPKLKLKQIANATLVLATSVMLGALVFAGRTPLGARDRSLEYFAIPPLLWAAFLFGLRGAITSACLISGIAIWGTLRGLGPFASADPNQSFLLLQSFMGTITLTALVLAAVVSERQRAEEALQESKNQLAKHAMALEMAVADRTARLSASNAELEAFSYSLSHDMRAPLRAIQSFTQIVLAEHGNTIGSPGTDYLKRTTNAAARLDRLIQDVLAISRLSRQEMRFESVNVEKQIRDLIQERPELQPPKAEIKIESPLSSMRAHEASLTQCLTNLLGNAVKFVAPGVKPQVRIWSTPAGEQVRLWIEDNGIGIEPAAQPKVFEMFQRLHSDEQYEGTGIGLAIVRKAVERMGGQTGVESEPGRGSRFWLQLPPAAA